MNFGINCFPTIPNLKICWYFRTKSEMCATRILISIMVSKTVELQVRYSSYTSTRLVLCFCVH